jgi:hypothetical protein
MIFNDPLHEKWDEWDYKLFKAHYILEDWYRDGIPLWWDESDRVTFDAKPRVSKSKASIERAQEANAKKKSKSYGIYFTVEPRLMDGEEMPTRDEWLEEQAAKQGNVQQRPIREEPHILQGKNTS